jgi:glycogen operon protein
MPLGVTHDGPYLNFAVFSSYATCLTLVLFLPVRANPILEIPLHLPHHRTGDVWHVAIRGLPTEVEYGYRVDFPVSSTIPGVPGKTPGLLLDPYAKAVSGAEAWGQLPDQPLYPTPWERLRPRRCRVLSHDFDWEADRPLQLPLADTIIYEVHVRGFTQHPSSGVIHPGTFLGLIEKIPYLQDLGITAVELMPITEFEENDNPRRNPFTGEPLMNYWGYHPLALFSPKASYAAHAGKQVEEFRTLVKALHAAGIEVILDMVFNHTGEGDEQCPTWSFRGLDNATYYRLDAATGRSHNDSGCGNTLNCNHPIVQDLIIDCLRYWVTEMHVDGFRFDLASVLSRGLDGTVLARPPILERIAADPVLARTKLIAEPWDATGLHQVGTFPRWGRWAEWNDRFRDDIRRFIKGDTGMVSLLATRLTGSSDLYGVQGNERSINFVTCHDGFTLADLVTYAQKHNAANGEEGRDGAPENFSWNCGEEGSTRSSKVRQLRQRQMKNLVTLLLLSRGIPMILSGDEMGRTQQGNNNAYGHDNALSWINWDDFARHGELFRFVKLLLHFRKRHSVLWRRWYTPEAHDLAPKLTWHGVRVGQPDWSNTSHSLAMHLAGEAEDIDLFLIANAHWQRHTFALPAPSVRKQWYRLVDTFLTPPADIAVRGEEPILACPQSYTVGPRSVVVLVGQ